MIFKNNNIARDTDAEHLARAQMMAVGVATYGVELDFTPAQILEYDTYATDIYAVLNSQHEESADVDEAYVIVHDAHDATLAKYRACQSLIKGEMESATPGTVEYLDERFDIDDDIPRARKGFLKMADFMVSAFDAIAVEHPDVILPATVFEELRTLTVALKAAMEAIGRELAEQKEATVSKNVLRSTVGEKLMRKCFHRAVAYWGDDDPRLLELGLVPKSSIWTPGDPEPGEPEGATYPEPVENLVAKNYIDPIIVNTVSWDILDGAATYSIKKAEVDLGQIAPPMPEDYYSQGYMDNTPIGDNDIVPGKTYYYWVCGVDEFGVEGEWALCSCDYV